MDAWINRARLRRLTLPDSVPGHLFLSYMPGRYGQIDLDFKAISEAGVEMVICLVPRWEIYEKSPRYGETLDAGDHGWSVTEFPIRDMSVPEAARRPDLVALVRDAAIRLLAAEKLLIHCAGGIGRAGTLAVAVQLALGVGLDEAYRITSEAGGRPESREQQDFLAELAIEFLEQPLTEEELEPTIHDQKIVSIVETDSEDSGK